MSAVYNYASFSLHGSVGSSVASGRSRSHLTLVIAVRAVRRSQRHRFLFFVKKFFRRRPLAGTPVRRKGKTELGLRKTAREERSMGAATTKSKGKKVAPNRDHYARVSFLHQAGVQMTNQHHTKEVGRFYGQVLKSVAQKNVLRLSPDLKRQLCKQCNQFLIPGYTCSIRLQNESKNQAPHNDVYTVTCSTCSKQKRFPIGSNPSYNLWAHTAGFEPLA